MVMGTAPRGVRSNDLLAPLLCGAFSRARKWTQSLGCSIWCEGTGGLVIVLCIIWAIECHLEGNSVIETIEAPLLVVAWGGLILLIDRWALRHTRGVR
jgi:hypothetical protein